MSTTFGASAPSQVTTNLDALFATSLAKYKKTLTNNISETNAFYLELKNGGRWDTESGSAYIAEDLVYELARADSYDGYDELPDNQIDGITQVIYQWRQGAVPISYSEKERKMNKTRLVNLVDAKIMQSEEGFKDMFNRALLQGSLANGGASIITPWANAFNGSLFVDPIGKFIQVDPTASNEVGNINQNTSNWWRNRIKDCSSGMSTPTTFLMGMDNLLNTCNRGPGPKVDLILVDQTTFELWNAAYFDKYRTQAPSDADYPFDNIKFRGVKIVWDVSVPDAFSATTSTATYGTAYFVSTKTFRMVVEESTDFDITDFAKPPKGDSRLAHILFMGQLTNNCRRRNGVAYKIPRTLTFAS